MAVRNIKLTVSYDGLNYSGWQNQPGKRTIQAELEGVAGELTGFCVKIKGASRTDAGVSALAQVANMLIDSPIPTANFVKALNDRLPRAIRVIDAVEVPFDFDAASTAKNKHYRYTIFTGKVPNVLKDRHCWHRPGRLDIDAMSKAAKVLIGKNDFKSFASSADKRKSSVRTIFRLDVTGEEELVHFDIEGDGFLYNMVRNIVGTLVEIGRGRWQPDRISRILDAKDRAEAGVLAPPDGLCLMRIDY